MEILSTRNLSFTYPNGTSALSEVDFSLQEGGFVTICGQSGCGKSTLLRLLKPYIAPIGKQGGEIRFCSKPISELSDRDAAAEIGFVMQNPDSQIVTDKVWHELAFALESVGLSNGEIRRRVSEMACYFGIEELFGRDTASLSGGQKQLLNLASAAALHPRVLLLDEPTSQLDPIAAGNFLNAVMRLNRDYAVAVVIAEHHLEELLPISDRVVVMEKGRIIADCKPNEITDTLPDSHPMLHALPISARLFKQGGGKGACPLSIREGRQSSVVMSALSGIKHEYKAEDLGEKILSVKELWYGYERNAPETLKGCSLTLHRSEIYAILGGNGSGKTTLLKIINGSIKPSSGRIKLQKNVTCAYLPQNPCELFTEETVREELECVSQEYAEAAEKFSLTELYDSHPYDLSGGEQQRLAIAKLSLGSPDILLMDEPTKGMDVFAKNALCSLLQNLSAEGKAVILVTHDTELAAQCADTCGLLFNGEITTEAPPEEFFSSNYFYTTAENRLRN